MAKTPEITLGKIDVLFALYTCGTSLPFGLSCGLRKKQRHENRCFSYAQLAWLRVRACISPGIAFVPGFQDSQFSFEGEAIS